MNHPDLLALLRGELPNAAIIAAGDHLEGCADCREELAELVPGHALLTRSAGTLDPAPRPGQPAVPPALSAPRPRRRRARRLPLLLAAAAVTVAAGVGVVAWRTGPDEPLEDGPAARTAVLDPVEGSGGSAHGLVEMAREPAGTTRMTITTRDLPRARTGQFYEAWLLDPTTSKMLPLGQLGPSGQASFELDDRLVGRYAAVDVSLEDDDGDPQHSVTSVLRASYDEARS